MTWDSVNWSRKMEDASIVEDKIKKAMGDKYHICHMCSIYADAGSREACRRSQPVTVGDLERYFERIADLVKSLKGAEK